MANPNPAALVNQPPPTVTRKSITGFVTKLVGDGATYGFINDEIFFQQTNVADGPAGVNDRVFADCEYSAHLPIKWNATSIKIVARASSFAGSAGASGHQGPTGILDSDPRRQSRQGMLLNQQQIQQQQPPPPAQQQQAAPPSQQQPQFPSPNQQQQQQPPQPQNIAPVANTYQQHRQQKQQQQQHAIPNQHDILPQPMGPIDLGLNQGPDFFVPFGQAPPTMPQFDTPMGPPKLEYTSQLGSAFVQNQFMPGPLLPQQAPLLPQSRPQQQQQAPAQSQQGSMLNRRDQQRNQHNKGGFNNEKNDRNNQNNRGRNRNDKFDQTRGGNERENSNSRSSRAGSSSRDRSGARNDTSNRNERDSSKREGIVKRPSPTRNSTRSTNSVSSDRANKNSKRSYDPHNIPRTTILTNMNAWNMRSRCPSSIHVPSDLKNIIVNPYLRLDVKNLPKPLNFKIEQADETQEGSIKEQGSEEIKKDGETEKSDESKACSIADTNDESQLSNSIRRDADNTPPSSKSDVKLNHKYGVKVVLISLPEFESIYKKVFGEDLDSFNKESKTQPRLDETISLLCNTAANGGHSLIGGKFDSSLDGFVEGEKNEFERHGRQPDLIATCRRVVLEQTGLDLGPCQTWTLVSTFIYNNKTDYFSPKASIEYSFIYMPHIWSMTDTNLDGGLVEKETMEAVDVGPVESQGDVSCAASTEDANAEIPGTTEEEEETPAANEPQVSQVTLENLSVLKVADLKTELEKRAVAFKPNAKKAELVAALEASLKAEQTGQQPEPTAAADEIHNDADAATTSAQDQLEEGEVLASGTTTPTDEMDGVVDELNTATQSGPTSEESTKRKAEDDVQQECKRAKKSEKVELIKDPFIVKPRKAQQLLSIVSLADVIQISRYDQFELSVASNILKEALVQHLSEYMFTALVEDSRQRAAVASQGADSGSLSSGTNSQETNSDSNDNNNNSNNKLISSKNLHQTTSTTADNNSVTSAAPLVKEYPVDRYINLAFAYFDSTHLGYLHADDLSKLFCNTGLTISKRALMYLLNENEKFNYRTLADLSPKLAPSYVYKFPDQFDTLPGSSVATDASTGEPSHASKMIEYQGVKYEVEKLIQQARDAETNRVNTAERFNRAIENYDKQAEEIHVLEVSRMSLSKSIKALNEELGELKRERELADKKFENLKTKLEEMLVEVQRK